MPEWEEQLFRELGASEAQQRTYRSTRHLSGHSPAYIAEQAGVSPSVLERHLAPFSELGVVTESTDGTLRFASTEVVVYELAAAQARAVKDAAKRLDALTAALGTISRSTARRGPDPAEGRDESLVAPSPESRALDPSRIPELLAGWARDLPGDVCFLRPDQWEAPANPALERAIAAAAADGRRCRAIYPVRILEHAPQVLFDRAAMGEQVRIVADVPTRLALFGHDVALLVENLSAPDARRVEVRERAILDLVSALFETIWHRAIVVPGMPNAAPSSYERRLILELLIDGARDEQIAQRLGVSLRTVRRRISDLLDELQVQTRFQAGVEAVRRGWL